MRFKFFLLGMFFTIMGIFAQDFYTIQLYSLSADKPLTSSQIESGIWKYQIGEYTKYFLGRFDTETEAKTALSSTYSAQYSGAFVVSSVRIFGKDSKTAATKANVPTTTTTIINTPINPTNTGVTSGNTPPSNTTGRTPSSTTVITKSEPVEPVSTTPKRTEPKRAPERAVEHPFVEDTTPKKPTTLSMTPPTIRPDDVIDTAVIEEVNALLESPVFDMYTVQIAAYPYPVVISDFDIEYDVMEFYCRDNVYRYTVGKTADRKVADMLLRRVKLNGYPEAYLIDYSKYKLYRIE